jgi:diguanylate cyclase (GGDEF)-like protein
VVAARLGITKVISQQVVKGSGPVLRFGAGLGHLAIPAVDIQLLHRTIKMLYFDNTGLLLKGHHLKHSPLLIAVPLTYRRFQTIQHVTHPRQQRSFTTLPHTIARIGVIASAVITTVLTWVTLKTYSSRRGVTCQKNEYRHKMSDKNLKNQIDDGVYSLRQRYLFVSSIVVALIFAFSWLAQSYVSRNSENHQQDIELRHATHEHIRELQNEVLHIEKAVESFMWTPSNQHREAVHQTIDRSLYYYSLLQHDQWSIQNQLDRTGGDIAGSLQSLHAILDSVMDMRMEKSPDEPVLQEVEQDITQAFKQLAFLSGELRHHNYTLSIQLETLLELWQQLHLQFNSYLSSKLSSVFSDTSLQQQQKIEELLKQIEALHKDIATHPQIKSNPPQRQRFTEVMASLELWQRSYNAIKLSRDNSSWRGDILYLKHTVEPHFERLWEQLKQLDVSLNHISQNEATEWSKVARTIAKAVWLLSFFGLAVITIAYLYFQGTVLKPIAMVAAALKHDAEGAQLATLPQVHNRETLHLINAYEEMHQQVRDRQQALEHIALHDSLTTLPNRYHLMGKLQALCETSRQQQAVFAVMMLGLDRFKEINDTLGQNTGDAILKKYGQRLKFLLRTNDSIARFAGDEFALLLPGAAHDEALYVARKIRNEMEHPIDIDGLSLSISCSIGIALYPDSGQEKEELTRRANIAMAIAKQHKIGIALYEERFDTSSVERISMAGKLRQAIQANELHLYYQPQFAVHSGELSGLEVLCRWDDPQHGPVSPEEFIPVAEQTGQIHALTEWVVTTALQQAAAWREVGLDCGILAINISVFNLHAPNFYTLLESQLRQWNFPAAKLMLEITETAMMADPEHAIKTLGRLRQLGLKLSIDDYGTGFSSLSYIKQLPVDELKIDKSFVMEMTTNENDAIIVRSTIDLAHNLGLKVVAEGVDSQEKQELLEILDCDYMQGFHLGRPQDAEHLETLLPPLKDRATKVRHLRDFR